MFKFHEVPDTNIVEFTIEGKITSDEIAKTVPKFVAAAEKHKTLRILKEVRHIEPLDSADFGKQIGEVFAHLGEITHVALVAEKEWEAAVTQMSSVYPFQVRFFELAEVDAARKWLKTAA